jgi:hypothetical protein
LIATGYDMVANLTTAPTRHVMIAGTDNLPPPPSTSTNLDGAADGAASSYGSSSLYSSSGAVLDPGQPFDLSLAGTYQGAPATGSWSCWPRYTTRGDYELQCSSSDNLLNDLGVGQVMPASFTIFAPSFSLTWAFPSPVGTWTLTGPIFSGQTLRCAGVATTDTGYLVGSTNQEWSLTAPDVSCVVF